MGSRGVCSSKRVGLIVPVVQRHRCLSGNRYPLYAASLRLCRVDRGDYNAPWLWLYHLLHVSVSGQRSIIVHGRWIGSELTTRAKLLARLILSDRTLLGYTDIGRRAFGGWASSAINLLWVLD
jgi:hypothetical protein